MGHPSLVQLQAVMDLEASTPGDQVVDQDDDRYDEQNVDESATNVKAEAEPQQQASEIWPTWSVKPRSQRTTRMTTIVQSMIGPLHRECPEAELPSGQSRMVFKRS